MESFSISMMAVLEVVSWPVLLFGTLAVFAGAITQGSTGLGFGMVAAPILMIINPIFIPGAPLVLAMLVSILIAIREWKSIDWKGLSVSLSGRIAGTIIAGLTMLVISASSFGLLFGLMVLGAVLLSITGWKAVPSNRNLVAGGFVSGYMGTITAIGAPPIALVYQHQPGAVVRATLAMFFAVGAAVSIVVLLAIGSFSKEQFIISMALIPAMLAGFWVSSWVTPWVKGKWVRYAVLLLSATAALILVIKSIVILI